MLGVEFACEMIEGIEIIAWANVASTLGRQIFLIQGEL
jgi:hypothetical protein